ncbi:LOW QUALITY PROTEIN: protein YIPF6 [Larimichthys crocea]|uniref:LOW QUALITY PROTEIN: protein YIPF6 n=1 Tax=Larimichthys crocea TaxID=215358 RepID=UPI000F5F062B|nr:LOW QUALITY PROTEIN: protein YIPF6 [Larimichthys crocea]
MCGSRPAEVNNPQLTWTAEPARAGQTRPTGPDRYRGAESVQSLSLLTAVHGLGRRLKASGKLGDPVTLLTLGNLGTHGCSGDASRPFAGCPTSPISEDIPVEGDISVPVGSTRRDDEFLPLDEPVKETILRDLRAVGNKFVHVLYPKRSTALLRDWDLWGPLLLCVTLALLLQGGAADSDDQGGPQFAEVFVIVWFGSIIITLNSKLLGGTISFFQSLCVLGYCIMPLTAAMAVCRIVLVGGSGKVSFAVRLAVVTVSFGWSTFASTAFLADSQPPNRKALVVYPVFLFYFVIGWMILTFSPSQ